MQRCVIWVKDDEVDGFSFEKDGEDSVKSWLQSLKNTNPDVTAIVLPAAATVWEEFRKDTPARVRAQVEKFCTERWATAISATLQSYRRSVELLTALDQRLSLAKKDVDKGGRDLQTNPVATARNSEKLLGAIARMHCTELAKDSVQKSSIGETGAYLRSCLVDALQRNTAFDTALARELAALMALVGGGQ